MRLIAGAAAAVLLGAACSGDEATRFDDLEQRIDRLEAALATSSTTTTTSTTLDITQQPLVTLPTETARARLLRELPAPLTELWEAEWCLDHPDELEEAAEAAGTDTPSGSGWPPAWRNEAPGDFAAACRTALDVADPPPIAADYDGAVDEAVAATTAQIVDEVTSDTLELQTVLEDMDPELRSFCGSNPDLVYDAAFTMGRLPQGSSDDLEIYWAVTRPQEYAAACLQAYESR
jgi:hypothetical protein